MPTSQGANGQEKLSLHLHLMRSHVPLAKGGIYCVFVFLLQINSRYRQPVFAFHRSILFAAVSLGFVFLNRKVSSSGKPLSDLRNITHQKASWPKREERPDLGWLKIRTAEETFLQRLNQRRHSIVEEGSLFLIIP